MNNKKKFEKPEMEVIEFTNDDIVTTSGEFGGPGSKPGDINGWW